MRKHIFSFVMFLIIISSFCVGCADLQKNGGERQYPNSSLPLNYLNSSTPIKDRVEDLLSRMTLEEKIRQLQCGWDIYTIEEKNIPGSVSPESIYKLDPKQGAEKANDIQKKAIEKTRLGIPIIIHGEALHGTGANGSTIFPQAIALAATWNPELMKEVASAIGNETRSRGFRQVLSPVINIARDVRWGRTEETYGEDPYLTSIMAVEFSKAISQQGIITTPKHYVANVGDGGRDSNSIDLSERILREIYFPPFKACIQKGNATSIMAAFNSLDGIPCSSNKWLLTDVLRDEWGFQGFVVSDYGGIMGLVDKHKTAATKEEAAKQAIESGLDIELPDIEIYGEPLLQAVKKGMVSESTIDKSVRRVLEAKFKIGLFENPYVNPQNAAEINNNKEHRNLALEAARQSIVLLKNNRILPISKNMKSIAVIGKNANTANTGGYSGWGVDVVTILEGIKNKSPQNITINFTEWQGAADLAKNSDVAIIVTGITEGEGKDRANLDLPEPQENLIKEVTSTGTPTIVVLTGGSAITMANWIDNVSAIVDAWYPGEEGGNAVAEVLFGEYNPAGRLPITFPKSVGQVPLYYNYKPSGRGYSYIDIDEKPLFPFGYGLSYTEFNYTNFIINPTKITSKDSIQISAEIQNVGKLKGDEVIQLYIHDIISNPVRPVKELKGFKRITLQPNEKKKVTFTLTPEDLSYFDINMNFAVEPGDFEVMIGSSSEDIRLESNFTVTA